MNKNKYHNKLRKNVKQIIENDGRTIKFLMENVQNRAIISLLFLPQMALYCREAQEFYNITIIGKDTEEQIKDVRDGLKIICDKYNRMTNAFLKSDNEQDEKFRNELKFDFMKKWNIHYNLGVYFDKAGHLIGDTQLMNFFLNRVEMDGLEQQIVYRFGESLGKSVARILSMSKSRKNNGKRIALKEVPIGYIDLNTNVESHFFAKSENKGLNLLMLHMLGMLGADKYVFQVLLQSKNTWRLRNEYITAHNIWSGLKRVKGHFEMESSDELIDIKELGDTIENGKCFFPSKFRNCMMHYNLVHENEPCIKEDCYGGDKVFLGLVESCFEGKDYLEYYSELREYMSLIEHYLNRWFHIDFNKINWDLQTI